MSALGMSLRFEEGLGPLLVRPSPRQAMILSVLDVGTFKTCCVIARLRPGAQGAPAHYGSHSVEVLGMGEGPMHGMKNGHLVDLDAAVQSVLQVVRQAESQSQLHIESIILNVACGRPKSQLMTLTKSPRKHSIASDDLEQMFTHAVQHQRASEQVTLHALPLGYAVDGQPGISDPVALRAKTFSCDMHVVRADKDPLRNLMLLAEKCHLDVSALLVSPYVSALSILTAEEAQAGVACIDLGAGTSDLAIFLEGQMIHCACLGMGGHNISLDLAREFGLSLENAERLKVLHGSAITLASDATKSIRLREPVQEEINRARFVEVIERRTDEIMMALRDRLDQAGFAGDVARRIVLTGGTSALPAIADRAQRILGRPVRLAFPRHIKGLGANPGSPSLATATGLLVYPFCARDEIHRQLRPKPERQAGRTTYLSQVAGWLRASF